MLELLTSIKFIVCVNGGETIVVYCMDTVHAKHAESADTCIYGSVHI